MVHNTAHSSVMNPLQIMVFDVMHGVMQVAEYLRIAFGGNDPTPMQALAELAPLGSSGCLAYQTLDPAQPYSKPAVLAAVAATWDGGYTRSASDPDGVPVQIRTVTISQLAYVLFKVGKFGIMTRLVTLILSVLALACLPSGYAHKSTLCSPCMHCCCYCCCNCRSS
jgi:hypothetical protein